ncbi:MAG: 4Fe-4S cluster-binding domain-containing protein [Prevotellaceae bacterium]|jgi:MoaA/NifB/PqqE/SkfB family radical SAM enzyme|nr:4Fe-4S cluster-binding domain-containing protein [Prevotellaceae bacterium]
MKEKTTLKIEHFIKKLVGRSIPEKILMPGHTWLLKILKRNLIKRRIFRFEVHLTEHCNLNCKYCNHFSSLAEKEFLDIETFERDLARISELTERKIEWVDLLGGEPLLHPQLIAFLNLPRKYFDTGKIMLVTNGILLLKQPDEFWQSCNQNNVEVRISQYPIKLDRLEINRIAKKWKVTVRYMGEGTKTMCRTPLDLKGAQDAKDSFLRCRFANYSTYLEKGKIYPCPWIPNIRHFNRYFNKNLQVAENDYIDIYKAKSLDEILEFLCKPVPFCRHCNMKGMIYGLQWGISKKEISEWV